MNDVDGLEPTTWVELDESRAYAAFPDRPDLTNPVWVAAAFTSGLLAEELDVAALSRMVTPESLGDWGDFSEASAFVDAIPSSGLSNRAPRAVGAPDVAYPRVLDTMASVGHEGALVIHGERLAEGVYPLTLVWRPEAGAWLVHAFRDVSPSELPRTSPGSAPAPDLL